MSQLAPDTATGELSALRGEPLYLTLEPSTIFGHLHLPVGAERRTTGAVLCAPFGWDQLATHRSFRALAGLLAKAGYPALRFDFPATGDSTGSPRDDDLLEAWSASVAGAADWLRAAQACERIVAFGVGLGGMIACRALATGAAIDDLVLWAVPARGSLVLREMRTFARLVQPDAYDAEDTGEEPEVELDGGSLNIAGFLITAETIAALEQLDLCALPVPDAARHQILMVGRDTLSPDRKLREHLEGSGAAVTVIDGPGYSAMASHPQLTKVPHATFERIIDWIGQPMPTAASASGAGLAPSGSPSSGDHMQLSVAGTAVREQPFDVVYEGLLLRGILAEPVSTAGPRLPTAVLLNSGAVRRVGPHRMWVEIARRWAALGVPTLRLDVVGLGDSDDNPTSDRLDDDFLREVIATQALAAFDALEARGHDSGFVMAGLCSGAYWGLHAALTDERVRGLGLVNIRIWFWSDELGAVRDARRTRTLLRKRALTEILQITVMNPSKIPRAVRTRLAAALRREGRAQTRLGDQIAASLDLLRDRGVEVSLLFSLGEPEVEDFIEFGIIDRLAEWPNLRIERVERHDHVVRPLWAQRQVHNGLDELLGRVLARFRDRSAGS